MFEKRVAVLGDMFFFHDLSSVSRFVYLGLSSIFPFIKKKKRKKNILRLMLCGV